MAALFEFAAQLGGVVSFAVVGDPGLAVGVDMGIRPRSLSLITQESRVDQEAGMGNSWTPWLSGPQMFHGGSHSLGGWMYPIVRVCGGNPGNAAHAAHLPRRSHPQTGNSAHVSGNGDLAEYRKHRQAGTTRPLRANRRYLQSF